jgi:hypothetical protein
MNKEQATQLKLRLVLKNFYQYNEMDFHEILGYIEDEEDFHIETTQDVSTGDQWISGIHQKPDDYGEHGRGYVWSYNDRDYILRQMDEIKDYLLNKLEEEEHELTKDELDYLRSQEDCCSECGARITENQYTTTEESRGEFWGAPANEIIVTGYKCSECGNEEEF